MDEIDERRTLIRERDFYRRLLDLTSQDAIEPLLDDALALIVDVTGAITGYVDVYDDDWSRLAWVQLLGKVDVLPVDSAPEAMEALAGKYAPYAARTPPLWPRTDHCAWQAVCYLCCRGTV